MFRAIAIDYWYFKIERAWLFAHWKIFVGKKMRDLGAAGENYFSAWCAASGMTANKSVSDMNGWDVFVEIDQSADRFDPESIHEGLIESKIQIKSTDGSKKFVDVELSNLKKMATTALPSFYVLMEFDGSESPKNAYLLHVDSALSSKILKRIAELFAQDAKVKLNKKNMRLNFTDSITPLTATKLKEMILSHVGPSYLSYIDQKRNHLLSAGNGSHKVNFTITGDDTLKELIDISLGKKGGIEVNNVHGSTLRFGIATDLPKLKSDTAILEMPDVMPDAKGSLSFRDKTSGRTLKFPVDLYRSVFNAWIPDNLRKIRIDANLFEIQLSHQAKLITITINMDKIEDFEIENSLKAFKLIHMLWKPGNVSITFDFDGISARANFNPTEGFSDQTHVIVILERLVKIKKHFELEDQLYVAPTEINANLRQLTQIEDLINGNLEKILLSFPLDTGPDPKTEVECFYVVSLELGGHLFIELVVFYGQIQSPEAGKFSLVPTEKRTLYKTVVKIDDIEQQSLQEEIINSINQYNPTYCTINLTPYFFVQILKMESSVDSQ